MNSENHPKPQTASFVQENVLIPAGSKEAWYYNTLTTNFPTSTYPANVTCISGGSYFIPPTEYKKFLKDLATQIIIKKLSPQLAEIHAKDAPPERLFIDVDLDPLPNLSAENFKNKQFSETETRSGLFDKELVSKLVNICNDLIHENFKTTRTMECYVTSKPEGALKQRANGNLKYHDGFHLHFPQVILPTNARKFLLDKICETGTEMLKEYDYLEQNQKAIDIMVNLRTPQLIYGCVRGTRILPYLIIAKYVLSPIGAYEVEIENTTIAAEVSSTNDFSSETDDRISDISSEASHSSLITTEDEKKINTLYKYMKLFRIHQRFKEHEIIKPKTEDIGNTINEKYPVQHISAANKPQKKGEWELSKDDSVFQEKFELVSSLVECLSKKRANDYHSWVQVGLCLKGIDQRCYNLFHDFSRKDKEKYNFNEVERKWNLLDTRGELTIASLHHWAKEDDPEKYLIIRKTTLRGIFVEAIMQLKMSGIRLKNNSSRLSHERIAKYLFERFGQEYKYGLSKTWYKFKGQRWYSIYNGDELNETIHAFLYPLFVDLLHEGETQGKKFSEDVENFVSQYRIDVKHLELLPNDIRQEYYKLYGILATNLLYRSFVHNSIQLIEDLSQRQHVLHSLQFKCLDTEFEKQMDSRRGLLCCENGILEFTDTGANFRPGKDSDFITKTTKINYMRYDDPDQDHQDAIRKINEILSKIHTNEDIREFSLLCYAISLTGLQKYQKFILRIGHGSNGKSVEQALIKGALGDYYSAQPTNILVGNGISHLGAPRADIIALRGIRYASFSETNQDVPLNVGMMKALSSMDDESARSPYGRMQENIQIQCQPNLYANYPPTISAMDHGTWRRPVWIPYLSKFVENPANNFSTSAEGNNSESKISVQQEFKVDRNMMKECSMNVKLHRAFLSILVEVYDQSCKHNISLEAIEPEECKRFKAEFRSSSDPVGAFFLAKIIKTSVKEDSLLSIDIFHPLIAWLKENNLPWKNIRLDTLNSYLNANYSDYYSKQDKKIIQHKFI
jgi:phage/plasmid-associated DNA primase